MNCILQHLIETFLWPSISTPNTISDLGPWSSALFPELTIDQWTIRAVSVALSPLSTQSSIKSSTIGRTLGRLIRLSTNRHLICLSKYYILTYTEDVECKAVVQIKTINLVNFKLLSRSKFGQYFKVLLVKCIEKKNTFVQKDIKKNFFSGLFYLFGNEAAKKKTNENVTNLALLVVRHEFFQERKKRKKGRKQTAKNTIT